MKENIIINLITYEEEAEIIKQQIKHLMACSLEPYTFDEATLSGCFRGCIRATQKRLCEK